LQKKLNSKEKKMNNNRVSSSSSSSGIGFVGLLTIVFIVLKLVNVIAWSWFWVLSPMWIGFIIFILIIILLVVLYSI